VRVPRCCIAERERHDADAAGRQQRCGTHHPFDDADDGCVPVCPSHRLFNTRLDTRQARWRIGGKLLQYCDPFFHRCGLNRVIPLSSGSDASAIHIDRQKD